MRRLLLATVLFGLALPAVAGEVPVYVGEVKGVVLTGLFDRGRIELVPGDATACMKASASGYSVFRCDVLRGASARIVSASGTANTVTFDRVLVEYITSSAEKDIIQNYYFRGTWNENGLATPVEVLLRNFRLKPTQISGHVKLTDHGVFGSISATQQ